MQAMHWLSLSPDVQPNHDNGWISFWEYWREELIFCTLICEFLLQSQSDVFSLLCVGFSIWTDAMPIKRTLQRVEGKTIFIRGVMIHKSHGLLCTVHYKTSFLKNGADLSWDLINLILFIQRKRMASGSLWYFTIWNNTFALILSIFIYGHIQ